MSMERLDRLILRFTPAEAAALLKLMGLEELPGLSVRAEYPQKETVERLVRSGVVMPCGPKTLVDRTVSGVVRAAAQSTWYLAADAGNSRAVMYAGKRFFVLVQRTNTAILRVEPIQNLQAAQPIWDGAVRSLGNRITLTLTVGQTARTLAGDGAAAREMLARLNDSEVE